MLSYDSMLSMSIAYLAVYDTLADWEPGHLLAELRTGRFTDTPFEVVTVAETLEPVTTMGGVTLLPDLPLERYAPIPGDVLILPGAELWYAGGGQAWTAAAERCLEAGVI